MATRFHCVLLIFAGCLIPAVKLASVKIYVIHQLPAPEEERRFLRQSAATACDDMVRVDRSSLQLTGMLSMLNPRVQFYTSDFAEQRIDSFLRSSAVTGLETVTAQTVLETLQREGCPVFIFGGVVRDQFLGVPPNDVDVEVECDVPTIVRICRTEWGDNVCGEETDFITHIGTKKDPTALDLKPTTETFYGPLANLEYTANSLAYDQNGRNVIIDLPGTGVRDVCGRKIRIPSDDDSESSWEAWRLTSMEKIYRFWKLRVKGFTAFSDATQNYIVSKAMADIDIDNQTTRGLNLKNFYCKKVYGDSVRFDMNENVCLTTTEECERGTAKADAYNTVLREDLGADYVDTLQLPMCTRTSPTDGPTSGGRKDGAVAFGVFLALFIVLMM